jgi:hypothetical protein
VWSAPTQLSFDLSTAGAAVEPPREFGSVLQVSKQISDSIGLVELRNQMGIQAQPWTAMRLLKALGTREKQRRSSHQVAGEGQAISLMCNSWDQVVGSSCKNPSRR